MDYLIKAFGSFAPHVDEDAAVKFALNLVLVSNRLEHLAALVIDNDRIGGMEGEPGWLLERRDAAFEGNETAYPGWRANARFRAVVDEGAYELRHPEFFMTRKVFIKYVHDAIEAFISSDQSKSYDPFVISILNTP